MRLGEFAYNIYSQFGEDGIIEHIFEVLHPDPKDFFCVEFGGSYDLACSNVANLWKNKGWGALLIEADPTCCEALIGKVGDAPIEVLNRKIQPTGEDSIDTILNDRKVDFMSIDIDGNDYHIWRRMKTRPTVVCIEFNPTVPPHVSIHQEFDPDCDMGFGASLKALIDLGTTLSYTFIGATKINAFFVIDPLARFFNEYEIDIPSYTEYTYLATDFVGNPVAVGEKLPWGIHLPYEGPTLAGQFFSVTEFPKQTMDSYEAKYGKIVRWPQDGEPNIADPDFTGHIPGGKYSPVSARNRLRSYCEMERSPICIAIAHVSIEQVQWVYAVAAEHGYQCREGGGLLTLFRRAR